MISFYPGPSRVHTEIPDYVRDAYKKGVLSINHRSEEFMQISERTISLLKKKLHIPRDYTVIYTTSATECWEIIAQSLVTRRSFHIFNGAFGQKWFDYTKKIASGVRAYPFGLNEIVNPNKLKFGSSGGVICITQNETSNGTQVSNEVIRKVKENNGKHLVAVDATSSMAGVMLDFKAADIWFASVQKCFGLPAGLGIMVCSPAAMAISEKVNERDHYNSLPFMSDMILKFQTPFTPNVLNIYLLMRLMDASDDIEVVHKKILKRFQQWLVFLETRTKLRHLVENHEARSYTVVPVGAEEKIITRIKSRARQNGILLGEGYGELKPSTFRIANFPAIKKKEIKALQEFLSQYQ